MEKIPKKRLTAIWNEIVMAEKYNEEELLPKMQESLSRYTGRHIPPFSGEWDIVLNEVYPIIQNQLPSIFFRNPRAFLKPKTKTFIKKQRDPITEKMESIQADASKSAKTQEHILNYTVEEMKYKKQARNVLLDSLLFPYGVMWHGYKGNFGMTEEQSIFIKDEQTFAARINPLNWLFDPSVNMANYHEGKWVARRLDIPLIDIVEDDKLNVSKKLKGFLGYGDKVGTNTAKIKNLGKNGKDKSSVSAYTRPLLDFTDKEFQQSEEARFVKVYEVFVRPTKKEKREGSNGWILLLTDEQDEPLRVNKWTIKAEGFPSIPLEFNGLPDARHGISDIDTYKGEADQKNVLMNHQLQSAQEMSKTWVGISKNGASEEDIEKYIEGGNTVVLFEDGNPRERMFVAQGGGASTFDIVQSANMIQRSLEEKSGVNDLKKGILKSGEESAFSVKQRAAGSQARPAYRQDIMAEFLRESYHYLNQLNKQFVPVKDAVRIMGSLDIEWSENISKEDLQADVDVTIDVYSMAPENPQEELANLNQTLGLMVQGLQDPIISQKLREEGKTIQLSPIIEQILMRQRINDPNIFRNIKPEESQGMVSVQQLREAEANVDAALTGQQLPHPPTLEDDHMAKLGVYNSINTLLQKFGQVSEQLNQLMQVQAALLQEVQSKQDTPGQKVNTSKPSIQVA